MNTKILDYFIAIAEENSITRAAERFFLTYSALSKHVRNMEDKLGASIFRYTKEGMQLTPEGTIFINNARAIRHLEQEMKAKLDRLTPQQEDVIAVAVDDSYYNSIVREIMPSFQRAHPDLVVELHKCNISQAQQLLLAKKVAFAVVSSPTESLPGLETVQIMENLTYCAYPPGFPDPASPDALRRAMDQGLLPILHPAGNTIRMIVEQQLVQLNIIPEQILEGNYLNTISHIFHGTGIGFLPEGLCDIYRPQGMAVGERFMRFYTLLAYLPERPLSAVGKELMEMIRKVISGGGMLTLYRYAEGRSLGIPPAQK